MSIRRGPHKDRNFTVLDNAVLNDRRLSYRARGLLTYLLSKPVDWQTNAQDLSRQSPGEGRDAVRTALAELETVGYLVRRKYRDEKTQQWRSEWTVYEEPQRDSSHGYPEPGRDSSDGLPAPDYQAPYKELDKELNKEEESPEVSTSRATPETFDDLLFSPVGVGPGGEPRCPQHRHDEDPPRCRGCAEARVALDGQREHYRQQQAERHRAERQQEIQAEVQAVLACELCDDHGYRGRSVCDHNPERDAINARGAAACRAALRKNVGGV